MSAPTPARSAMVEAVRPILRRYDDPMLEFEESHREADIIAAVLDNLPREVMAEEVRLGLGYRTAEQTVDAAISTARREVLGHD